MDPAPRVRFFGLRGYFFVVLFVRNTETKQTKQPSEGNQWSGILDKDDGQIDRRPKNDNIKENNIDCG